MKKTKKIIIILIVVCLVIVLTIGILINSIEKQTDNSEDYDLPVEIDEKYEKELNQEVSWVKSENDFFTLENQIKNFFLYYKVQNTNAVYELINEKYIEENNIVIENIIEKLSFYKVKENNFSLIEAYARESMMKPIYYVYGVIEESEYYMTINWDLDNSTFSITPITKLEYGQYITGEIKEENNLEIKQKQYNNLQKVNLSDEEKAEKYFKNYIKNAIYNVEKSYFSLNEEYRNKKFTNLQSYKEYLAQKKDELQSMDTDNIKTLSDFETEDDYLNYVNNLQFKGLTKYSFTNEMDNKICICIDYYGNYYIFNIIGAMQYTVILDTYTLDLPEFMEKYDKGTDKEKIKLNINKIIEAINNQDYQYVYNKLDGTFKNNNFNNESTFENYIKNNFYESNEITNFNYRQEGNVFICTISLGNKENEAKGTKSVTILMKLLENRDFEISFSQQ